MKKKRKLFFKLYPSYLFITIGSLCAASWFFAQSSKNTFINQERANLEDRAHFLYKNILATIKTGTYDKLEQSCREISRKTETRITLISPTGEVLAETDKDRTTMGNHADRPEIRVALEGHSGTSIRYSNTVKKNMLYVAIPILRDNSIAAVLRTSVSLNSIENTLNDIYAKTAIGAVFIAIITAVISIFVGHRVTAPLIDLKEGVATIARGVFEARLPTTDIEEFADLAGSVNNMAEQLTDRLTEITEQNNERNAILSSMLEGVLAIDNTSKIISINKAARRLFKISKDEAKGRVLYEVIRNTALHEFVDNIFITGETIENEFEFYNASNITVKAKGTILRDINDNAIGALIVLNDVTQIRRLERFRKDFVANVSHEIRTPLTVIMGSVEALLGGALNDTEDAERFMKTIAKHSDRLNALVSDILDLSKIEELEKGKNLEMTDYPVDALISTAVDLCRENAQTKNIAINVLPFDEETTARVNNQLFEQALVNLLSNAIKYSESDKSIEVSVSKYKTRLSIAVKDNGYGIPQNHLGRLFERFYRVDKARRRQEGGTGLGLAIVKHITQVHNGEVKAESEFGKGSTFTITIPM